MISVKKILVPTDFSEHSEAAVRYGEQFASTFGAELHLLHTVETQTYLSAEGIPFPIDQFDQLKELAKADLDNIQIDSIDQQQVIRTVCEGNPFVEIVNYAKNNSIDLIVVGTHGRGAIAHMLLGSVAEHVVRKSPCPVLVVRDKQHEFVMP